MSDAPWWRGATIYQVYVRSFCDSNGDGQGDLAGLRSKLDYIEKLGVDGIWLSPIHPSPNRDWGYDISDYDGVHPDYGTLEDFHKLVDDTHARGIRVILDEVLCHTSDEHAWFRESLLAKDNPKADWYVWADPKLDGTAPNNWLSAFGGPAWSYMPSRRQHFHHKFLRQQPKLNWRNRDAKTAALNVLKLWLERGADGYRLDVANAYLHDDALADNPPIPLSERTNATWSHAANFQRHRHDSNLPENIHCLDEIRRTVAQYPNRFVFGEFSEGFARSGAYEAPDKGLHSGYTFAMLRARKLGPDFIRDNLAVLAQHPDHWPCISFSNHDVIRTVTRFGGAPEGDAPLAKLLLAILFSQRGTILLYQGEELGLTEVDLPRAQLRDPVGDLYYPVAKGRDGCRTPMPWHSEQPSLGFSSGKPWLPPGPAHGSLAVSLQEKNANSTLSYARAFLATRKKLKPLQRGSIDILSAEASPVLAYVREHAGERVLCVFNMSREQSSFENALVADAEVLSITTGAPAKRGTSLTLAPLSAWFARV